MKRLLQEHLGSVYRFALRLAGDHHVAEDLAQETFLRAWRRCEQLRETASARTWLLRITANLWRDQVRRGKLPVSRAGPLEEQLASGDAPPERKLVEEEQVRRALAAMDTLPPRQRSVIYLHACEGLAIGEISNVLNISSQAAKSSLSLARKKMREQLGDVFQEIFRHESTKR